MGTPNINIVDLEKQPKIAQLLLDQESLIFEVIHLHMALNSVFCNAEDKDLSIDLVEVISKKLQSLLQSNSDISAARRSTAIVEMV